MVGIFVATDLFYQINFNKGRLRRFNFKHSKTSFEKNCFSAWASTLNMGLINKVDMVCLSPVGYGVIISHRRQTYHIILVGQTHINFKHPNRFNEQMVGVIPLQS